MRHSLFALGVVGFSALYAACGSDGGGGSGPAVADGGASGGEPTGGGEPTRGGSGGAVVAGGATAAAGATNSGSGGDALGGGSGAGEVSGGGAQADGAGGQAGAAGASGSVSCMGDADWDHDGVTDVLEGCATDLDTDGDGQPDWRDLDSDGDWLPDALEDLNGNGKLDTGETARTEADTDGDGAGDLAEVALLDAAAARDPAKKPDNNYVIAPWSQEGTQAATPTTFALSAQAAMPKVDVGFVLDTTGSMGPALMNLKNGLSTLASVLAASTPELGVGVAAHQDVPSSGYGACTDLPFLLPTNGAVRTLATASVIDSATVAESQGALGALTLGDGVDLPEAQIPGLMRALNGTALSWGAGGCAAGSMAVTTPTSTTFGALRFRYGALPILISSTDAPFHNGVNGSAYPTTSGWAMPTNTALKDAINAAGARFVGLLSATADTETDVTLRNAASTNSAYGDMAYLTDNTNSTVPPSALGGSCKTGLSAAALSADGPGGTCRLVFSVQHNGAGLIGAAVTGVNAVTTALKYDLFLRAASAGAGVDAVDAFVEKVVPSAAGGVDAAGAVCATILPASIADRYSGPKAVTRVADGSADTIVQTGTNARYCYQVTPKPNTTVTPTAKPQVFKASFAAFAEGGAANLLSLGSAGDLLFIVPPSP